MSRWIFLLTASLVACLSPEEDEGGGIANLPRLPADSTAAPDCDPGIDWTCPPEVGTLMHADYEGKPLPEGTYLCLITDEKSFGVELWPSGNLAYFGGWTGVNLMPSIEFFCWDGGKRAYQDHYVEGSSSRCWDPSGLPVACDAESKFPPGWVFPPGH